MVGPDVCQPQTSLGLGFSQGIGTRASSPQTGWAFATGPNFEIQGWHALPTRFAGHATPLTFTSRSCASHSSGCNALHLASHRTYAISERIRVSRKKGRGRRACCQAGGLSRHHRCRATRLRREGQRRGNTAGGIALKNRPQVRKSSRRCDSLQAALWAPDRLTYPCETVETA